MRILIVHRNKDFALFIKNEFDKKGNNTSEIMSVNELLNSKLVKSGVKLDKTILILDAHVKGYMINCEGFNVINELRLRYNFINPTILLTWFKWMDDFKVKKYLEKYLQLPYLYKYSERKLKKTIVLSLPITLDLIEDVCSNLIRSGG